MEETIVRDEREGMLKKLLSRTSEFSTSDSARLRMM